MRGTQEAASQSLQDGPGLVLWIIGAVVVFVLIFLAMGDLFGEDECDRYNEDVAEQVTILQMADETLSFTDALVRAELIEGPPPAGC